MSRLQGLRLGCIDVQGSTASYYAATKDAVELAFLVKSGPGSVSLEGRSNNKEVLAALLEEAASAIA